MCVTWPQWINDSQKWRNGLKVGFKPPSVRFVVTWICLRRSSSLHFDIIFWIVRPNCPEWNWGNKTCIYYKSNVHTSSYQIMFILEAVSNAQINPLFAQVGKTVMYILAAGVDIKNSSNSLSMAKKDISSIHRQKTFECLLNWNMSKNAPQVMWWMRFRFGQKAIT